MQPTAQAVGQKASGESSVGVQETNQFRTPLLALAQVPQLLAQLAESRHKRPDVEQMNDPRRNVSRK
jgi:hypothetical protein